MQRYENKSKSQLLTLDVPEDIRCLRLCKDTKIKANHNKQLFVFLNSKLSKTLQRYENKSKSQLLRCSHNPLACCLRLCKDTKIKANHNMQQIIENSVRVV